MGIVRQLIKWCVIGLILFIALCIYNLIGIPTKYDRIDYKRNSEPVIMIEEEPTYFENVEE